MKVQINEPCPANWDKMQIKLHARHCEQCDKSVIDFTQKSRAEIITFLLENPNGSVCGRMNRQQFDILEEDLPELISIISQPRFRANAFLILAIVCSSLFQSCESKPAQTKPKDKPKTELKDTDPLGKIKVKETVKTPLSTPEKYQANSRPIDIKGELSISPAPEPEPKIAGGISYEPIPPYYEDEILSYAEVMPEFPGGMNEMLKFINQNFVYPQELIETDFSGRIFVQFVVTKTGEIEKVSIVKGIDSISGLNQAAIRLVKQMPKWTPGINNGKEVNVKMVIPIRIELN
jgi:TonB family protein